TSLPRALALLRLSATDTLLLSTAPAAASMDEPALVAVTPTLLLSCWLASAALPENDAAFVPLASALRAALPVALALMLLADRATAPLTRDSTEASTVPSLVTLLMTDPAPLVLRCRLEITRSAATAV